MYILFYIGFFFQNGEDEIAKIAKFLGLDVASDKEFIKEIIEKCQINNMRAGKKYSPEVVKTVFREGFSIYRKGIQIRQFGIILVFGFSCQSSLLTYLRPI